MNRGLRFLIRNRPHRRQCLPVPSRGLGDAQFDAVARHLEATLIELGVARDLIDDALEIVAGTRSEVLGR
jgi:hemoglobin